MAKMIPVLVIMGLPFEDDAPMPATIVQWPSGKRRSFQHLSAEQRAEMGDDMVAIWDAECIEGHYWLSKRLRHLDDQDKIAAFLYAPVRSEPIVLDDGEIPF